MERTPSVGARSRAEVTPATFHALTFVAALTGLALLWAAVRKGVALAGRHLVGLMLTGWGAFNLVEGIVDHQILTVHHVNMDGDLALARSGLRAEDALGGLRL